VALSSLPPDDDRRIRDFVSAGHMRDQSVGYGKTAMVFHMLRARLGAEAFDAGLRRFWSDHAGAVAGWSDLQAAFETVSDSPLDAFFEQWLDRPGLPDLHLAEASVSRDGAGHVTTLALTQTGAPFALRVPVTIETETGPVQEIVTLEDAATRVALRTSGKPLSLSVDPGFDILRHLLNGELPATLRDVLRIGDVAVLAGPGATEAARTLSSSLLRSQDPAVTGLADLPAAGGFIAVGATADIAALRDRQIDGPAPAQSRAGHTRAWVETDTEGRPWLFASADRPAQIPDALSTLRYFGNQSYVVAPETGRPTGGRWPVSDSPLTVVFGG
jgi:aminopeptidase N